MVRELRRTDSTITRVVGSLAQSRGSSAVRHLLGVGRVLQIPNQAVRRFDGLLGVMRQVGPFCLGDVSAVASIEEVIAAKRVMRQSLFAGEALVLPESNVVAGGLAAYASPLVAYGLAGTALVIALIALVVALLK